SAFVLCWHAWTTPPLRCPTPRSSSTRLASSRTQPPTVTLDNGPTMTVRSHRETPAAPTRSGPAPARLDRRTKDLTKRLQAGDIAVIKHSDIDRISAEAL